MAFNAKTAGILAGLAVGLASGVFMAALNPMIPRQDPTEIALIPESGTGEVAQDDAPTVAPSVDAGVSTTAAQQPAVSGADEAPATDREVSRLVVAGQVGELKGVEAEEESEIALLAPTEAPSGTAEIGSLPEPSIDPSPELSTDPATPLILTEPDAGTEAAIANPEQPEAGDAVAVETPAVDPDTPTAGTPKQIDPKPLETAALPELPAQPSELPAQPSEVQEQPSEVQGSRNANTSGTFSTATSRLPSVGGSGDASNFTNRDNSGSGLNLPSISGGTENDPEANLDQDVVLLGALQRNAVAFEATDKPLMSVILLDIGADGLAADTLIKLTIPASFALPVEGDQPRAKAQIFKSAGFEVLALSPRSVEMSLSGGLSQDQVSTTLDKIFSIMPEAIGLIDRPAADLQKDRKLAKAVIESFRISGHGLVTYNKGLNSVPREAGLANVAAGNVFRILDENGENPSIIERYLNRAALDARREGHVIVMGTTAPETVTAIVNWSLSSKARAVVFAPVSASLLQAVQ